MAFTINGINEVANPMLIVMPIFLVSISGYGISRIISSKIHKINGPFFKDLMYGNMIINFFFISGFIIFGVLTYHAKEYFIAFTYTLLVLSLVGTYFIVKKLIAEGWTSRLRSSLTNLLHSKGDDSTSGYSTNYNKDGGGKNAFVLFFGVTFFVILIGYHAIIIYFHPIFNEYDSIYLFLPISKSILLGNGLNHNYFSGGSDISVRYPPYTQALNAWLIQSFGYSSLRAFPVYFVFFAAIALYYLAKSVTRDRLLRIIASIIFLIAPAILVISSRFSLQQDFPFIFFLTAGFNFLFEIVVWQKDKKLPGGLMILLIISLSLLPLTREVGLILSVAIFFLVPAIKFTSNNLKLRGLFTVLSLLPLYVYEITGIIEVVVLLLANLAIFYIVFRSGSKSQNQFSTLITPHYLKTLIPLVIPLIFIVNNLIVFSDIYPSFTFSSKLNQLATLHNQVFGLQNDNDVYSNPIKNLEKIIPRIDILFISIATGSIFIYFKLLGFTRILYELKGNAVYSLIIILFIFLLIIWSYLLQSGFERSDIRHVAYFIPILSIIIAAGLTIKKEPFASSSYYVLYYYCVIAVLTTYYILHYSIHTLNYDSHFGGFWVDPFKNPIMPLIDLAIGAALVGPLIPLIISQIKEHKKWSLFKGYNIQKYSSFILVALLILEVYVLSSAGIPLAPPEKIDKVAPRGWDENVFDAINYLKTAQSGNVLSVRAPAISFFTNRTNFDLYSFQTFATLFSPLLLIENPLSFKQKLLDLGIRYILVPNEKTPLYHFVQNLGKQYKLIQIIDNDDDFEKISLRDFNMYKFVTQSSSSSSSSIILDLIDGRHIWKSTDFARILQDNGTLDVTVNTTKKEKIFNRVYLQTQINLTENRPLLLSLNYSSQSHIGKAVFYAEISEYQKVGSNDLTKDVILWASRMNNTAGKFKNEAFVIPASVINKPIELKFYIISDGLGKHSITVKKATITYT